MPQEPTDAAPAARLMGLILGGLAAQTVRALVDLGVADRMGEGVATAEALAEALGLHAPSLDRLLQAAVTLDLAEAADGGYGLTETGRLLRGDVAGGLAAVAHGYVNDHFWTAQGGLADSVRNGLTSTRNIWDATSFELYGRDPALGADFDAAMTGLSDLMGPAVAAAYDFKGLLVDVGGGQGRLMAHILQAYPDVRGLLFDLPRVAAKARAYLAGLDLSGRCAVAEGDLLEAVPEGGDLYMMSAVIHDWEDAAAIAALKACRRAMGPDARLLLVERVLSDTPGPNVADQTDALVDLMMMIRNGGRERSASAYRDLLAAAGFEFLRVIPTGGLRSLIEARPV